MDIALLMKVIGVGLIVTASHTILTKAGRDDQATLVSVAGAIVVFLLLVGRVSELFSTIRGAFGL